MADLAVRDVQPVGSITTVSVISITEVYKTDETGAYELAIRTL